MKELSCGVVYMLPDKKILLGRITGHNGWCDIPKGKFENEEMPAETAARELLEETGININYTELVDFGVQSYTKQKKLHIFVYYAKRSLNLNKLKCSSYFTNKYGRFPEIDGYRTSSWEELHRYIRPNLLKVLRRIENGCF